MLNEHSPHFLRRILVVMRILVQANEIEMYYFSSLHVLPTTYAHNKLSKLTEFTFYLHYFSMYVSLSTVVLNSRDRHENVWLPKNMRLENNLLKIRMQKTNYSFIGTTLTTLTSIKVAKCC